MDQVATLPPAAPQIWAVLPRAVRPLLIFLLFGLFPVLVIQISFRQIERLEAGGIRRERDNLLENLLLRLKDKDDDSVMILRSTNRVFEKASELPLTGATALYKRLIGFFPGAVELFVFDRHGALIPAVSSRRLGTRGAQEILPILGKIRQNVRLTESEGNLIKTAFQTAVPNQLRKAIRTGTLLARRDRNSYAIWNIAKSPMSSLGGYFCLIHSGEIQENRAIKGAIRRANQKLKTIRLGFLDMEAPQNPLFPEEHSAITGLGARMIEANARYGRKFEAPGKHGVLALRERGGFLFALSPLPGFFSWGTFQGMNLASVAWLFLIVRTVMLTGGRFAGRIPAKLMTLFLAAVGIPALILLIAGFYSLRDHENIQVQSLEQTMREKLGAFDEQLPLEVQRIEKSLQAVIQDASQVPSRSERAAVYRRFEEESVFETILVVNEKGENIFVFDKFLKYLRANPKVKKMFDYSRYLGREILRRLNNSNKIDSGAIVTDVAEGVISSFAGSSEDLSIDSMVNSLGKMHPMNYGGEKSFFYANCIPDLQGKAIESAIGHVSARRVESFFLQKSLRAFSRQPDMTWRVSAVGNSGHGSSVDDLYQRVHLSLPEDQDIVMDLHRQVLNTQGPVRKILPGKDGPTFWLGVRGSNFSAFTMVAASPLGPLKSHIRLLWIGLLGVAVMIFLTTGFIGYLLAEQIIVPVRDISLGIHSIETRKFDHRIPVHGEDELGEMTHLLNQVIEGMKDLEVARIVQESLFPAGALTIGEYCIFGRSRAMSDIGGDYFDYFPAGDTRIVGLVGDVSGHGVSAALIMGMAKCAFTLDENINRDVLDNLNSFNQFMLKTIKRKKMMTCFYYSLETIEHRLRYVDAGHNYPLKYQAATGTVNMLEQDCYPLGMRKKPNYSFREVRMDPGDIILFYTDGLIESPSLSGEPANYSRAQEWFVEASGGSPQEVVDAVFSRFDQYTLGAAPVDDVSLICLKRSA
jgi:serine phosphatase RsbU (regulator of sigma subunit)